MLIVKGLIGGFFQIALFAALLLIPAGTWHWPRAIAFLVLYGLILLASIVALARLAPASLEARLQMPVARSQPRADRVASAFLFFSSMAWFVWIPIDVFRLRLLPPPPLWVSIFGVALLVAGFGVMMTALIQNAFAAPIVKDQSERGHVLVDTGVYSRLRHPFYLGFLVFLIGIGLWLESYASVLVLPLVFVFVVVRIFVEERTLRKTLPGYTGYMEKVPYRLVPFVW